MEENLSLQIGGVFVLGAIGFVFPLAWIGAVLLLLTVAGAVLPGTNTPRKGHHQVEDVTVTAEDWLARYHACCESPAETAFLDAMIAEFDLKPDAGRLGGRGLTLHLQVPALNYRLDFLIDPGLVVEIDGATYHSSPEAVARDKERDKKLAELGYQTLRIPARVVLNSPAEAIARVNRAWAARLAHVRQAEQDRAEYIRDSFRPTRVLGALGQALSAIQKGVGDLTDEVHRKAAEFREQDRLKVERETAEKLAAIQAVLDADPELQKIHDRLKKKFGW